MNKNMNLQTISTDDKEENLLFNPYNPLNIEISSKQISEILYDHLNFDYKVNNLDLFKRAFVHRSYCKISDSSDNNDKNIKLAPKPKNCLPLKSKSNERLEFLGDGVLEMITKFYLYIRFPKGDEGFMTEKKIAIVKNEHIGVLAYKLGLQRFYIVSNNAEDKNIRHNYKKLGCLFEAFLGALFLDANKIPLKTVDNNYTVNFQNKFITGCGMQICQIFLHSVFEKFIDWGSLIEYNDNYKNNFQVILQKEFKTTPQYIILSQNEDNEYEMGVFLIIKINDITTISIENSYKYGEDISTFDEIHSLIEEEKGLSIYFAKGINKNKKKAEQYACEMAVKLIKKI